jgi:hypothetical protein
MMSPLGVLIPSEWCAEIAGLLGQAIQVERRASPTLMGLVDEMVYVSEAVSATSADGFRDLPRLPEQTQNGGMTVKNYAKHIGRSERRVRQLIAEGHLPANQPGGPRTQWAILEEETK